MKKTMINRRSFLKTFALTAAAMPLYAAAQNTGSKTQPNILFLAVDDWNDWVGCLGADRVKTPNMDRLAKMGMLFTNAHCAAPVCNPSRSAILSGLRPSTSGVYANLQPISYCKPAAHLMLPEYFKTQGYTTAGSGKIYHDWPGMNIPSNWDDYYLWNETGRQYGWFSNYSHHPVPLPPKRPVSKTCKATKRNFDWYALPYQDNSMPDYKSTSFGIEFLQRKHDKPFFLAVGQFRPHVPWFVPKKYFDMYPLDKIELPPYLENDVDDLPSTGKKWAHPLPVSLNLGIITG